MLWALPLLPRAPGWYKKMNSALAVDIVLVNALLSAASQLMLKVSAGKTYPSRLREYLNPWVLGSYALLFGVTLLNMVALQYLSFLFVNVAVSTSYVFVVLFSRLLLKERITRSKWLGMCLVFAGILVFYAL